MGLDAVIKNAVATADAITKDLQPQVEHHAWVGEAGVDGAEYAPMKKHNAIVEYKPRRIVLPSGQEVWARAYVLFVQPIPPTGINSDRLEPIDPRDKIVLPDGSACNVVDVRGVLSKSTKKAYLSEVWVGELSTT